MCSYLFPQGRARQPRGTTCLPRPSCNEDHMSELNEALRKLNL